MSRSVDEGWRDMSPAEYEAAVLAAVLDELRDWPVGVMIEIGRMIEEPVRLEGSRPDTELVVVLMDTSVGRYHRRYRIWRNAAALTNDDRHDPRGLAMDVAQDLLS